MAGIRNDVLVAIMNSKSDFIIAHTQNWYRIPVKSAPLIVKNHHIRFIAFYHTSVFEKEKFSIKWFAKVKQITVVKRKELLPDVKYDPKAENEYYKIEFEPLCELPKEIISIRHRRLLFVPTTIEKLLSAREINYLFNDSPLEDIMWARFMEYQINAERQFYFPIKNITYFLDFAIFCKIRNINVECDGDKFHTGKKDIQSDKSRSNMLESYGWSVLRFTTHDIIWNLNETLDIVNDTINNYGGIQDVSDLENFKYIRKNDEVQGLLFD
jgi:very-short-patch-repair endonuclease